MGEGRLLRRQEVPAGCHRGRNQRPFSGEQWFHTQAGALTCLSHPPEDPQPWVSALPRDGALAEQGWEAGAPHSLRELLSHGWHSGGAPGSWWGCRADGQRGGAQPPGRGKKGGRATQQSRSDRGTGERNGCQSAADSRKLGERMGGFYFLFGFSVFSDFFRKKHVLLS